MLRITIWNENSKQDESPNVLKVYPDGLLAGIANIFNEPDMSVKQVYLDMSECGVTQQLLEETDVLVWWGHSKHHLVSDEVSDRIREAVNGGMGFLALHSSHLSKPFLKLMGTSGSLRWRDGEYERVWCINPGHPIADGIPPCFDLECEEMYGEMFDIPQPESTVFLGWFRSGEVFRSGNCWTRGMGKVFYFQPGHETDRSFYNEHVRRILVNAARWAAPTRRRDSIESPTHESVEMLAKEGKLADLPAWYK